MVANVLIAINHEEGNVNEEKIKKVIENNLLKTENDYAAIGRVVFVGTKKEAEAYLLKGMFDVFMCTEILEGENIAGGTIRLFKEQFPNVNVFLLVETKKKGQKKLQNLYEKGYYDAIYFGDLANNPLLVFQKIAFPTTKEDARIYYGLPKEVDEEQEVIPLPQKEEEDAPFFHPEENKEKEVEEILSGIFDNKEPSWEKQDSQYPPQIYLDIDSLGGSTTVSFEGSIAEIITDEVMIINCPARGLLLNKRALKGRTIDIVIRGL